MTRRMAKGGPTLHAARSFLCDAILAVPPARLGLRPPSSRARTSPLSCPGQGDKSKCKQTWSFAVALWKAQATCSKRGGHAEQRRAVSAGTLSRPASHPNTRREGDATGDHPAPEAPAWTSRPWANPQNHGKFKCSFMPPSLGWIFMQQKLTDIIIFFALFPSAIITPKKL